LLLPLPLLLLLLFFSSKQKLVILSEVDHGTL
jgi:hypothetical protein